MNRRGFFGTMFATAVDPLTLAQNGNASKLLQQALEKAHPASKPHAAILRAFDAQEQLDSFFWHDDALIAKASKSRKALIANAEEIARRYVYGPNEAAYQAAESAHRELAKAAPTLNQFEETITVMAQQQYGPKATFKKLISAEELADNFSDLEEMRDMYQQARYLEHRLHTPAMIKNAYAKYPEANAVFRQAVKRFEAERAKELWREQDGKAPDFATRYRRAETPIPHDYYLDMGGSAINRWEARVEDIAKRASDAKSAR